ncbi:unnamed protein product [Paramecium sonneborni]|uniref:Uncharacterized protein n=1 Tax=Paramecium sonneborni TaxID=65129 RepID=A0A8S1Q9P7_9CILI|nr:unnamed protein product [Paramecium sonneborni]
MVQVLMIAYNVDLIGSTCKSQLGYFYSDSIYQCVKCHSSFLDFFDEAKLVAQVVIIK